MNSLITKALGKVKILSLVIGKFQTRNDDLKLLMGRLLSESVVSKQRYRALSDLEFRVFSQFGDDGIVQYVAHHLDLQHKTFVEFGVNDYFESNTRFLMQNNNWSGFVMDGSSDNIDKLKNAPFFWKHDLNAKAAFVTKDNVVELLAMGVGEWDGVDLLHIDIDGNDYWVWEAIGLRPAIVILEYNSKFGIDRAITVPYKADFYRTDAHFSNLYWGSSLKALYHLTTSRGYEFIGCNSAGNNAYFVREDKMNVNVRAVSLKEGYVQSKYRESRDKRGRLTYVPPKQCIAMLKGLPVFDIELREIVSF